jgi:ferredoxin
MRGASKTKDFEPNCLHCNACVDVCYMGIDPRKRVVFQYFSNIDACVNCGDCVAACEAEEARHGKAPVLQLSMFANKETLPTENSNN